MFAKWGFALCGPKMISQPRKVNLLIVTFADILEQRAAPKSTPLRPMEGLAGGALAPIISS